MALTTNANATKFEDDADHGAEVDETTKPLSADERVAAAAARQAAAAEAEAPKPAATTTAVAAPRQTAVVTNSIAKLDPFKGIENAVTVDYNTLMPVMASNGNIIPKEQPTLLMGDKITAEIISIQKHWVMSPGGDQKDPESKKYLRFSDDGIHVRGTAELLTEAQEQAVNAGYEKARIVERRIIVGMFIDAGKQQQLNGELFQMDLAPQSVKHLDRHRLTTAAKIAKGLMTEAQQADALKVTITAQVQNGNGNTWTDAIFSPLTA